MDKLEKALEKARQQRGLLRDAPFPSSPRPFATPQPPLGPNFETMPAAVYATVQTPVEEQQLERSRILAHRSRSAEADVFRILRTQVLRIMEKSKFRTLAITSPHYGDGKTTTALNLALSISQDLKQTVLLVDLDLRKPNIHEYLGLEPKLGLSDYLTGKAQIPQCLTRLSFDRLSILPAGSPLDNSSEQLGSPKMAALARELKGRYADRIVIYDMPPVLNQDDSIAFLPNVDATLVVIRDGTTQADELKTTLGRLSGANVIGTVLNQSMRG